MSEENLFGTQIIWKRCECCSGQGQAVDSIEMGKLFRQERKRLKISTAKIGKYLGISQQEVCKYELGQRKWAYADINLFRKAIENLQP